LIKTDGVVDKPFVESNETANVFNDRFLYRTIEVTDRERVAEMLTECFFGDKMYDKFFYRKMFSEFMADLRSRALPGVLICEDTMPLEPVMGQRVDPFLLATRPTHEEDSTSLVVGAIDITYQDKSPAPIGSPLEYVPPRLYVANLAVRQRYRRLGIGRGLLEECAKLTDEYKTELIYLDVKVDNSAAVRLYESAGFEIDDTTTPLWTRLSRLWSRPPNIRLIKRTSPK